MTHFETIGLTQDARGVATLTLNRPEKHNAMSAQMIAELTDVAGLLSEDSSVRVVVLTAVGKSFCAGGDLAWMRTQMEADANQRAQEARKLAEMLHQLNVMPKPLICIMQGNAFGGGIGLLSVCDYAIGVETAQLCLSEVKLGLIPATIGPYVVGRMGEANARRVFMSGRVFGAHEAQQLGLLSEVTTADQFHTALEAQVSPYLKAAPEAVARAKALVRSLGGSVNAEVIDHTIAELVACWESETAKEGVAAFFSKTKPSWITEAD